MEKYTIRCVQDRNDDAIFVVFENESSQIFDEFVFLEDAKDCVDFMERGGAFDGFTPSFMLKSVSVDINAQFEAL